MKVLISLDSESLEWFRSQENGSRAIRTLILGYDKPLFRGRPRKNKLISNLENLEKPESYAPKCDSCGKVLREAFFDGKKTRCVECYPRKLFGLFMAKLTGRGV